MNINDHNDHVENFIYIQKQVCTFCIILINPQSIISYRHILLYINVWILHHIKSFLPLYTHPIQIITYFIYKYPTYTYLQIYSIHSAAAASTSASTLECSVMLQNYCRQYVIIMSLFLSCYKSCVFYSEYYYRTTRKHCSSKLPDYRIHP